MIRQQDCFTGASWGIRMKYMRVKWFAVWAEMRQEMKTTWILLGYVDLTVQNGQIRMGQNSMPLLYALEHTACGACWGIREGVTSALWAWTRVLREVLYQVKWRVVLKDHALLARRCMLYYVDLIERVLPELAEWVHNAACVWCYQSVTMVYRVLSGDRKTYLDVRAKLNREEDVCNVRSMEKHLKCI